MSFNEYQIISKVQFEALTQSGRDRKVVQSDFMLFIKVLIGLLKVNKTVEIGAFEGSFSRECAKLPGIEHAVAFEANPSVYKYFVEECQAAGVDYRNNCIGTEDGKVELSIPLDYNGGKREEFGQIASILFNKRASNFKTVQVDGVRLDSALNLKKDDRLAIWVDVEGATSVVLPAAKETLRQTDIVQIEVESKPIWDGQWLDHDVYSFMKSCGFSPLVRDIQRPTQYNMIYLNDRVEITNKIYRLVTSFLFSKGRFAKD